MNKLNSLKKQENNKGKNINQYNRIIKANVDSSQQNNKSNY